MKTRTSRTWLSMELPVTSYPDALALQHRLLALRLDRTLNNDLVLILEHPPVFTLGRRGGLENLMVSREFLKARGIPMVQTERGGNITYHGPGQLVIYPIVDLRHQRLSIPDYVAALEEVMIRLSAPWGVNARHQAKNRGVWVGERKLGSVGVAVRKNVAFHGLAFNAAPDLTPFSWIQPCGLTGVQMTSIARETGSPVPMDRIRNNAIRCIEDVFGVSLCPCGSLGLFKSDPYEQPIPYPKTRVDTEKTPFRADL